MSDDTQAAADVTKSRKGVITALVAIVLVAAAMVAVAYAMGIGPFAESGKAQVTAPEPAPSTDSDEEKEAEPTAPAVALPSAEAQEVMFWEQVASREQTADLVDDKFASFELSQITENATTGDIRVKGTYREGGELTGWLLLRKYNTEWYFAMITRDGNPATTPVSGEADAAVTKAIAEGNAANQEVPVGLLDGSWKVITVDKVTKGSGTAMIDVTFSGGTAADAKGQITCISKTINGVTHWFITGFSKS